MAPTGRRLLIQKKPCYEWERRFGYFTERFWVDPSRDCVIVAYQAMKREQIVTKMDIGYREEGGAGYVPNQWTISVFSSDGMLDQSV